MGIIVRTLTRKKLKKIIHYSKKSGLFTWKEPASGRKLNKRAGTRNAKGYIQTMINGKRYLAHRLAWLYVRGYLPENLIDHKDRIRHNNRWKNLREISFICNLRNCNISKRNTSGIIGVSFHKLRKMFIVQINAEGKRHYLGYFKSKKKAALARWKAEVKYNFPNCNTKSTAYLYLKSKGYKKWIIL